MAAAVVNNVLYVTGGVDGVDYLTSILSWNPSTESWQPAGDLAMARAWHGAVAVPSAILSSECSEML